MDGELSQINETTIMAQYGPMRLTIQAWGRAGIDIALAMEAGRFSFSLLPRLVPARELFRRDIQPFENLPVQYNEPLFTKMTAAVRLVGQKDLGPMATVAGVVAETVADYLWQAGAVKVIVENGGDLALRLAEGQSAKVGVRLGLSAAEPAYALHLTGSQKTHWGVCSSGLGGRSLTRGIADTSLCVAESTTAADAAATALGNACFVDSPAVKQVSAECLRPDTDIAGLSVTASVGALSEEEIKLALDAAALYAEKLVADNIILGALVALRGQMFLTNNFADKAAPLFAL